MKGLDEALRNATKKKDKGKGGDGTLVQQSSIRTGRRVTREKRLRLRSLCRQPLVKSLSPDQKANVGVLCSS